MPCSGSSTMHGVNPNPVFSELFVEWRKQVGHDYWAALSNNKRKKIALTEFSEYTTDDLLTWARVCVSLKLVGCSPCSQMLSNHKEANTKFIAIMMEALQVKLYFNRKRNFCRQKFLKFSAANGSSLGDVCKYLHWSNIYYLLSVQNRT